MMSTVAPAANANCNNGNVNVNVNIQMPMQMNYNNGESIVQRPGGLIRVRKGQSEEAYREQKLAFWACGPVVQNHTVLTEYVEKFIEEEIDNTCEQHQSIVEIPKIQRETIIHGLERLYFERQYERCLKDLEKITQNIYENYPNLDEEIGLKKNKSLKRIINELKVMSKMCLAKLEAQNQKNMEKL